MDGRVTANRTEPRTNGADTAVRIAPLRPDQRPALDAFLAGHPDATIFHSPDRAGVIRSTYGHECRYWTASAGDRIAGAFPVTVMKAPGFGCKFVAMAYQMHSGVPLAEDAAIRDGLVDACIADAERARARYIEIRHFEEAPYLEERGFIRVDSGLVTTTIPIRDLDLKQAEHGHRQRVRKAVKLGVTVTRSDSVEDLRAFRAMYLETGRAMGAPQAGWRYFTNMRDRFGPKLRLYLARQETRMVGGFLVVAGTRLVFARCSAHSSSESLSANAGQALWWKAMTDAADAGCATFNCGISWEGDAGLIHWKEAWGGTSRPVHIYVLPLRAKPPEPGSYFEGFGLAKAVWKRLPLPIVDFIGHHVTRWIG